MTISVLILKKGNWMGGRNDYGNNSKQALTIDSLATYWSNKQKEIDIRISSGFNQVPIT